MAWNATVIVAAHTAVVTRIDAGTAAARFKVFTAAGVLLGTLLLADPCGTVNGTSGIVTLAPGAPDTNCPNGGTAGYAVLYDGDDVALTDHLPVAAGTTAIAGTVVLSSLDIVLGGTLELIAATIG